MKLMISKHAKAGVLLIVLLFMLWVAGLVVQPPNIGSLKTVPLPSAPIPHAASSKEIIHGDTTKKQVIFTFDGGDGSQSALQILATLAEHRVKGTFFLTGKFVETNPALVRKIASDGNEIFSHTYDHPHLPTLSDTEITGELSNMASVLEKHTGISPQPFFRAPYGDRDDRVLADAWKQGYESVYWTVDALDWEEPNGETAPEVEGRILSNLAPGNIYLMHLGDDITGRILNDVFTKIEAKGYHIVSLTQGI